jgi:hypothetical protein
LSEVVFQPPVKYIAEITGVREVTLRGSADLGFWQDKLNAARLRAKVFNDRGQVAISAIAAKYGGIRFRELSVSVVVDDPLAPGRDAFYLVHAFHSSRLFAWIERNCFATPYYLAEIHVSVESAASILLGRDSAPAFDATASTGTPAAELRYESWEGRIYLPPLAGRSGRPGKWFAARLAGETEVRPFAPGDRLEIAGDGPLVLQWLAESGFFGQEWWIRKAAIHARSKTFRHPN